MDCSTRKIIIEKDDQTDDVTAVRAVLEVVKQARVSGDEKSFCFVPTFNNGSMAYVRQTKTGNDVFRVSRLKGRDNNA